MTELAVGPESDIEVSRIELDRSGPSYTVDTLDALTADGRQLVLILGADAVAGLGSWYKSDRVRELAELAVVPRDGLEIEDGLRVQMVPVEVASTEIRRRLAAGETVADMVPPDVVAYISQRGLYVNHGV